MWRQASSRAGRREHVTAVLMEVYTSCYRSAWPSGLSASCSRHCTLASLTLPHLLLDECQSWHTGTRVVPWLNAEWRVVCCCQFFTSLELRCVWQIMCSLKHLLEASAMLGDLFSSAGWAIHINWSKCCLSVCVCVGLYVWMLTRVAQMVTAAHRDL